jgi:imidazolonepropionase-like amidohydrolase
MIIHCQFREPDGSYSFRKDLAERIVKREAWVNPTFYTAKASVVKLEQKRSRLGTLARSEVQQLADRNKRFEEHCDGMRRLLEMGAKMMAGSDSPWADYEAGKFVHEIEVLADIGMSNVEAIAAGTSAAAESIGLGEVAGTLNPGRPADILIVKGNPAEDLGALWNVREVYQKGQPVQRGVL